MGEKNKGSHSQPTEDRSIVSGGAFTRMCYDLNGTEEDIKNCIVEMFQFLLDGNRLSGPADISILDKTTVIPTEFGDIVIDKQEHPLNKDFEPSYYFTVPLRFFLKRTPKGGKDYESLVSGLKKLRETSMVFSTKDSRKVYTVISGVIDMPEVISYRNRGEFGKNSVVSFVIKKSILQVIFDFSQGFSKFMIQECRKLTGIYAKRMYEILCNRDAGTIFSIRLGTFKAMFRIENKYRNIADFKRFVFNPMINEINSKTSLTIKTEIVPSADNEDKVLNFTVVRKGTGLIGNELAHQHPVYPRREVLDFLKSTVMMKPKEVKANMELLSSLDSVPNVLEVLEDRWYKCLSRIGDDGWTASEKEDIRCRRIGYMINAMRGLLSDRK